jgi:hypothetical protein
LWLLAPTVNKEVIVVYFLLKFLRSCAIGELASIMRCQTASDNRYPTLTRQLRAVNHVNPVWAEDHRIPLLGLVTRK